MATTDRREDRLAKLSSDRGPIPPVKLAHVVRNTSRFDEMVRWYRIALAAEIAHADAMLAFLTFDEEHHRIAIVNLPGLGEMPPMTAGTDHIAFAHADIGDLLHGYVRLAAEGITPFWCINHGPTTSMYYRDPDGNKVEFQVDNFDSTDECNAWMRKGEFAANPIGVIFDPEKLLARYRAGEPKESLLARPPLPEGVTPFEMLRF